MSLECGYCERDLRGPHAPGCAYVRSPEQPLQRLTLSVPVDELERQGRLSSGRSSEVHALAKTEIERQRRECAQGYPAELQHLAQGLAYAHREGKGLALSALLAYAGRVIAVNQVVQHPAGDEEFARLLHLLRTQDASYLPDSGLDDIHSALVKHVETLLDAGQVPLLAIMAKLVAVRIIKGLLWAPAPGAALNQVLF